MTPGERLRLFGVARFGDKKGAITAFAKALGMKPSNLHKYLSDEREPGAPVLARISALGCNVHWLLKGEGEMYADNEIGRQLKRTGDPMTSDPMLVTMYSGFRDGLRSVGMEIERLKRDLEAAGTEEREELLQRLTMLLERKAEMLQQENLLQQGQIMVYEKMFEKLERIRIEPVPGE